MPENANRSPWTYRFLLAWERLKLAVSEALQPRRVCDGSPFCEATTHIHGCYADAGNCDHPDEQHGLTRYPA